MALTTNWSKQLEFTVILPSQPQNYTTTVKIDAKLNSQNIANNTSNVSVRARIKYGYPWYAASPIIIRAGKGSGSGSYNEYTNTYTSSSKAPTTEITSTALWTGTITHNQDGTGTLPLYGYIYQKEWGVNKSKTGSVALPTIPRASLPTITPNPFNIGDTITITTNKKVSTYTDDLFMNIGSDVEVLGTDVADSVTIDTSQYANQFYALIPNTSSYTSTIDNSTYDGSTFIGSNSISYTANVVDAEPTFTLGYRDTNSTTTAITGNNQQIIRNQSTLQINITNASALYGASLVSASVDINGNIYTGSFSGSSLNINVGTVDLSSNENAVVTVTDSRGLTTTKSVELQILDWQLPSAIIECARQNNYYTETNVKVDADYSSLDSHNTITITFKYKKTTDSTYTTTTLQDNVSTVINMDNLYDWDIQVIVADAFGSTTYNLTLNKGVPLIFFDRKRESVSIGCFPQRDETIEAYGVDLLQDKQDTLVSGTNIKTINNTSLLGSGNINISSGGTATDVEINGTSITSNNTANIAVDGTYNASTNKIATMSSLPTGGNSATAVSTTASGGSATTYSKSDHVHNISSSTITSALGFTPADTNDIPTNTSDLTNDSGYITNSVNNLTNYSLTTDIQTNKNLTKGIEYIVGSQTASTNAWTGVSTDTGCSSSTMYVGKTIVYHLPYAGTSSAATLNLTLPDGTTTGAKTIHRLNNTTVTTTFAAGCDILMIWNGTNWKINAYVDTNTNTIGYQLRTNSAIWTNKTGYSMNRYMLFFEVDGGLSGAATTIGTGTTKTTVAFKYIPNGMIYYNTTSATVANNANFTATGMWEQYVVDLRYTFNTGTTLTSGKPVYMRCVVNSDGTLTPNYSGSPSHPIVQDLPTTADGYVYVFLGQAYSTTSMELIPNHPIYEFKDGKLRLWQYDKTVTSSEISTALGYTPANENDIPTKVSDLTNDSGYITGISSTDVTNALGYTPYNSTNPSGYISGITSSMVTSALGYTPYNSTNPNGYITSSALSPYVLASSLASVATSGSYNDLSNTPTIPEGISELTGDIRIWNLDAGIYKLSDNASHKVYYKGATDTTYITASDQTLVFITKTSPLGSTYKDFIMFVPIDGYNQIYSGWTNSTTGSYVSRFLSSVETTTNKVTSMSSSSTDTQYPSAKAVYTALSSKANASDIPTKVSDLTNDAGYTSNTGTITSVKMNGSTIATSGEANLGTVLTAHQSIKTINNTTMTGTGNVSVQPTLVSGTNIKTINNTSLLGSGNISLVTSSDLATVATSGSYNDLDDKPTIPTLLSQLTNDTGFIDEVATPLTSNFNVWSLNEGIYVVGNTNFDGTNYVRMTTWQSEIDGDNISYIDFMKGYLFVKKELMSGLYPIWTWEAINILEFNNMKMYTGAVTKPENSSVYIGSCYEIDLTDIAKASEKQDTLVSGTNIKTINNQSLLGSGNIDVSGGGSVPTDVRINGTSITSNDIADIITNGTYNATTNKIATMSDIPSVPSAGTSASAVSTTASGGSASTYSKSDHVHSISSSTITNALGYTPYNSTNPSGYITSSALTPYALSSSLATVATSGSYNDLSDTPTIPSVGNSKIWYGTSATAAATQAKVVTCSGFTLETGATIIVTFTYAQTYNGTPTLNVNSTGAKSIQYKSGTSGIRYMWNAGSTIQFVYNGTYWVCEGRDLANTTYYGITKLNDTVTSTSTTLAATANSVKTAYDLANTANTGLASKQDTLVSGTSIKTINNTSLLGSGDISLPTSSDIPTKTSDLTNDSDFITSSDIPITDIKVNNTSVVSSGVVDLITNTAYNSSTNKLATMSDLPSTSGLEQTTNKVTSISSSSTDTQYPSAKCVYNEIKDLIEYSSWDTTDHIYKVSHNSSVANLLSIQSNGKIYMSSIPYANSISNDSNSVPVTAAVYSELNGKQDKISDTGWQTLTLASGFSASTGSVASTPQYRKIGNHVYIRGTITFTRTSSTQIFATAASDYIPTNWVYKIACVQGTRLARIGCNPSTGQMFIDWIYPTNSTTAVTSGTITWLDITMDWFTD